MTYIPIVVICALATVSGCGDHVSEKQWEIMSAACQAHGGIKWTLSAGWFADHYEVLCVNGERITIPVKSK